MPARPRILLLGDSIRMSYQPHVARLLEGQAEVTGPDDNCQYSLYAISSLDKWLEELGTPDIIHWNNGIHDAGYNPQRRPVQIPLEDYRGNIELLVHRLLSITPKVIWASCTPVHPDKPFSPTEWSWRHGELEQYNAAAREVVKARDVPVNDLYSLVRNNIDGFLADDMLHLSEAGEHACAEAVVKCVSKLM